LVLILFGHRVPQVMRRIVSEEHLVSISKPGVYEQATFALIVPPPNASASVR